MKKFCFIFAPVILSGLFITPSFAQFSPGGATITTTVGAQSLSANTGTINIGGSISIASGSTVPLTMTGTSILINNGTIQTLGTGRAIDSNSAGSNLTITNTGLISSVSADAFRVNNSGSSVSLTNSGTIQVTAGGQAIDWAGITTGSNSLTNQIGGSITAVGEDAVRPGQNGIIINAGTITATPTGGASPTGSDGIDLRTEKTVTVTNTGTITGRHGIATDGANVGPSSLTVNNNTGGTITALNGSGLNVDGVSTSVVALVTNQAGATIQGGVLAVATNGDGDGIDIDGILTLNNSGSVLGLGAKGVGSDSLPNGAQAVSIGGGTINNFATGQIIGSTLSADAPNGDNTRAGEGILADNSSGGNAIAATTVINNGLIRGKSGAGIRIVGTFADVVTNNAGGTIRGAGTGAAIQTGDGGDTVTNSGTIIGDNGSAIDLQAGNDTLTVSGGSAVITGNIDGGAGNDTLSLTPGTGNTFTAGSVYSNFETINVNTGKTTLTSSLAGNGNGTVNVKNGGNLNIGSTGNAGNVTVESGGTISGTGTAGTILLQDGSVLAPGNSPGTLNATEVIWDGGADFVFELGTVSDALVLSGALTKGAAGTYEIILADAGGLALGLNELFTFNSTTFVQSDFTFTSLAPGLAGDFVLSGSSLSFNVTTVPEPSSYALMGLGLAWVVWQVRRSRRQVA